MVQYLSLICFANSWVNKESFCPSPQPKSMILHDVFGKVWMKSFMRLLIKETSFSMIVFLYPSVLLKSRKPCACLGVRYHSLESATSQTRVSPSSLYPLLRSSLKIKSLIFILCKESIININLAKDDICYVYF